MTVGELIEKSPFKVLNQGDTSIEVTKPFCCDLLSICMSKTPVGAAWVTVMGNINTLAVLTLTDAACIILAEGAVFDEPALKKASEENVTVFATELPVFEAAMTVWNCVNDTAAL